MPSALRPLPPRRPVGRPSVAVRAPTELTAVGSSVLPALGLTVPPVPLLAAPLICLLTQCLPVMPLLTPL